MNQSEILFCKFTKVSRAAVEHKKTMKLFKLVNAFQKKCETVRAHACFLPPPLPPGAVGRMVGRSRVRPGPAPAPAVYPRGQEDVYGVARDVRARELALFCRK